MSEELKDNGNFKNKNTSKKRSKAYIFLLVLLIILLILIIVAIVFEYQDYNEALEEGWIPVDEVDISSEIETDAVATLSIPSLNDDFYIDMPIKNSTELSTLAVAIGHFDGTPWVSGNVCLAAHNSGINSLGNYVGYFDKIKNLNEGDLIYYTYDNVTYTYEVLYVTKISETDTSVLENTEEDILTLITCVKGSSNRGYRYLVVAEKIED